MLPSQCYAVPGDNLLSLPCRGPDCRVAGIPRQGCSPLRHPYSRMPGFPGIFFLWALEPSADPLSSGWGKQMSLCLPGPQTSSLTPGPPALFSFILQWPRPFSAVTGGRVGCPTPTPKPHPPGSGPESGSGGWVPVGRPGRLAEGSPGQVCGSPPVLGLRWCLEASSCGQGVRESPGLTCRTLVGLFQVLSLHGGAQASPGSYFPEHGGVGPSLIKAAARPASPEEELSPQSGGSGCCENHLHLQTIVVPAAPTPVTSELPRGCAGWDLKLPDSQMSGSWASQGPWKAGTVVIPTGLREIKPVDWDQRASGRDEGFPPPPAPVGIQVSSGASSGTRRPQAGPGDDSVSPQMRDISAPSFSAALRWWVTSTHPARSSHWRGAPFAEGEAAFLTWNIV